MAGLARPQPNVKTPAPFSHWRARAALFLIALVAYFNSFSLGLAQDSKQIVTQDPRLQSVSAQSLGLILGKNYWWPKTGDGLYRPVTTLSLWFNYSILGNGPNPAGYHVVNFLLHVLNVWLLYQLALLILRRPGPAFFAAALWAVHPIATEAVTSIVGRADLLAAMSVLGGLLLYAKRSGWANTAALFAVATLGVFAKENAAVLLGLMLLYDLAFEGPRRWLDYGAVAASLAVLAAVRYAVLGSLPVAQPIYVDNPLRGADFLTAHLTALKVVGLELWLLLFPVGLSCDRSFDQIALSSLSDLWVWISLLAVAAILAVAFIRRKKDPVVFWAAGFFAIAILPTSNLVIPIGAAMAERFLYLPSVAFAVIVAALLYRLKNQRMAQTALIALLVLYAGRTLLRNPDWRDDFALASADVETTPRSFRLHDMLAKALFEQDPQRNLDRAIGEEEKSWDIVKSLTPEKSSEYPPALLGIYYSMKASTLGSSGAPWYAKSVDVLLKARAISEVQSAAYDELQRAHGRPLTAPAGFPQLYFNLANDYLNLGNFPAAVETLRYGLRLAPRAPEAYDGLGISYATMGNLPQAAATFAAKAQLDGFQQQTLAELHDVYQKMPDASCAFNGSQLNVTCPRVREDLCQGSTLLAQAFTEARQHDQAAAFKSTAAQRYGCPAN